MKNIPTGARVRAERAVARASATATSSSRPSTFAEGSARRRSGARRRPDRQGGRRSRDALVATDLALAKLPKVEGSGAGQVYFAPPLARVFDNAEKIAKKAGDSYVTVERLLLALAMEKDSEAGKSLNGGRLRRKTLNTAIEDLRKGRTADNATAENAYDALKKYARDLTEAARAGKLDPVIGRDEEIRRTIQVLSRGARRTIRC